MRRTIALLVIGLGLGLSLASCDSSSGSKNQASKSSKSKSKKKADKDSASGEDDSEASDDASDALDPCDPKAAKTDEASDSAQDEGELELKGGLALTADSLPSDVRKIFDSCTKCHRATGFLSFAPGDFTKTEEVIRLADESVRRVQASQFNGVMPPFPSPKLSEAEITTLKDWAASLKGGGSPATSTSTSMSTNASTDSDVSEDPTTTDANANPCDDGASNEEASDSSELVGGTLASVLNSAEKTACHTQGLAFLREISFEHPQGRCHEASYPPKFTCSRSGVLTAYEQSTQIKDALDAKLAEGYVLDDCGMLKEKAAIFLTCFHQSGGKCLNPAVDKVTGSNIEITVSVLTVQ